MREYIQFLIARRLRKESLETKETFGSGSMRNLSDSLLAYLHEKEQRKRRTYERFGRDTLRFDSTFESGNLAEAYFVTPTEYNLYMCFDTNTRGHFQWFYFKTKNTRIG